MRICVFGVGALGGTIAAKLHLKDADVWLHDVDSTIFQLKTHGLNFVDNNGCSHLLRDLRFVSPASDNPIFDYVILAVKAHQIPGALRNLSALIGNNGVLVTIQNGIPWWYFHGLEYEDRTLQASDPGSEIANTLDMKRVIGCIAYPAAEELEPGFIRHVEGNKLSLGELDGSRSSRCADLADILKHAGFRTVVTRDIRSEIWLKALGNLSFNPVSALTRMTMQQICEFEPTKQLVTDMMYEAEQVAKSMGVSLRVSVEKRLAGAQRVGHHKTSMLQDLEAGRSLEIDALLGSVIEVAARTNTPVPNLEKVYALTKALDRSACGANPTAI